MKHEHLVIEAGKTEKQYFKDLWKYRELFYFLAWRDILVRYKQTVIGVAWAVIRPLLTALVFTVVFGKLAKLPSDGTVPYPLLVFAGMLPWQFFATSLSESSNSVVANANMISKIYFPRLIIPASSVIVCFVDFLISFVIFFGMCLWYQFLPSWQIVVIPFFMLLAFMVAVGSGLWLSALNVKYRDFRYVIPFIVQFGLYVSPVGFSSSIVQEQYKLLYYLNPMVSVIDGFRWCLLEGQVPLYMPGLYLSCGIILIIFISGFAHFRSTEKKFADII